MIVFFVKEKPYVNESRGRNPNRVGTSLWAADDGLAETFDDYVNFAIIRAHSTGPFEAQVAKDSKLVQKSSVEQQISCQDLQQGYSLFVGSR